MRRRLLLVPIALALAACGGDDDATTDTVPAVGPTSGDETEPSSGPPTRAAPPPPSFEATPITGGSKPASTAPGFPLDPALPQVQAAVADLAGRLGVDPADVAVVDARAVTWGDSSLGCPEPGMNYMQVLVDGMLVVLKSGGQVYEYHGGDPLFLCENPKPPSGG